MCLSGVRACAWHACMWVARLESCRVQLGGKLVSWHIDTTISFFFHKQIGLTNMKYTCSERRALCLQAAVNPSGQNLRMSKQTSLYS